MSVQDIYNKLRTVPDYHPSSVELFDDFTLEAGDVISVQSGDEHYALPIFAQHTVWTGSAMVTAQSQGEQERKPLPALQRKLYGGGAGGYQQQKENEEKFKRFEHFIEETDERFSMLYTESEWDELSQSSHITAYSQITQTAREISTIVAKTGINSLGQDETLYSAITQNADKISLVVESNGGVNSIKTASIVAAVNNSGSSVAINADKIVMNGQTIVSQISGIRGDFNSLVTGITTASYLAADNMKTTGMTITGSGFLLGGNNVGFYSLSIPNVRSRAFLGTEAMDLGHYHTITASESNGVISLTLGATRDTEGTANFNIADTQFYKDAVSAAYERGKREASITLEGPYWGTIKTDTTNSYTVTAGSQSITQQMTLTRQSDWQSGGYRYVYMNADGVRQARIPVYMPSDATITAVSRTGTQYGIPITVTCKAGGQTYTANTTI